MRFINTITSGKVTWVLVSKSGKKEIDFLKKNYSFELQDLKECLPPLQRQKITQRLGYIFVILQFPIFDKKQDKVVSAEVDLFIQGNTIVTLNNNSSQILKKLFKNCQENPEYRDKLFSVGNPTRILHEIFDLHYSSLLPILNEIALATDNIEEKMFEESPNKDSIRDLLEIKRNIVHLRKIMKAHKNILERLVPALGRFAPAKRVNIYFQNIIDEVMQIWASLENYRDAVNALHETNESLSAHRLNKIMKTLTIFSVVVFPLTLLAAIFGMNTDNMPLVGHPFGFWIIVGIMFVGMCFMFAYFKSKKWI